MLQLCFRSSYLSKWSWWRKRHCLHQGMLEQSFRWCWFLEKYPWGGRWLYDVSRPSICHYQKLWKCHHCFWWYRCVCLFDLPFQLMDLSWFEGNVNSQWKEWLNNSVSYPSTGGTTRVKCCWYIACNSHVDKFSFYY